jgi:outer membrane lipoprotein carrier protein
MSDQSVMTTILRTLGYRDLQRVLKRVAVALLLLQTALPVQAQDSEKLQVLLADLQTFQADVRQLVMESSGSILEESQILFMLQRPDGFYWETLEPFPELIVTDGNSLWNYQPDLLQLTIDDWDADQSELAAQLLSGKVDEVAEQYSINAVPVTDGGMEFVLQPLDPASLYQQVTLYFEEGQPESILLVNTNGQRTFWEFNNRQINLPLSSQQFVFQAPDDDMLEIIDNRSTPGGGNQ